MSKGFLQHILSGVTGLILSAGLATGAARAADTQSGQWQALLEKADRQGQVDVILVDQALSPAPGSLDLENRSNEMSKRQDALFAASGLAPSDQARLPLMPAVTARLDRAQLEGLSGAPGIGGIFEDEMIEQREPINLDKAIDDLRSVLGSIRDILRVRAGKPRNAIAILDGGVDITHPDLMRYIAAEACFSTEYNDGTRGYFSHCFNGRTADEGFGASFFCRNCSHGTHVAGIALKASRFKNRDGALEQAADLVPVQVFSTYKAPGCKNGICFTSARSSDVIRGLAWVWMNAGKYGIRAVNISLGSGRFKDTCDRLSPYGWITAAMQKSGIAIVAASGNEGHDTAISRPACASGVIAVGSTDEYARPSAFSNISQKLDFYAHGERVESTVPRGGYARFSGTSMASPHVAGVYSVLLGEYGYSSVEAVTQVLRRLSPQVTDGRNGMAVPYVEAGRLFGYAGQGYRFAKHNGRFGGAAGFEW